MKKIILIILLIVVNSVAADENVIRDYPRKSFLLSDSDVDQIKNEIRTRCNLPVGDEISYPWYYHYEVGLAMEKRKDWQRALDSFFAALDRRDKPQQFTRIYGMWFIDYYPYYNIGLAHYNLGNWKCAVQSFRLSQMLEHIPSESAESYRLRELESEAELRLHGE